MTKAELRRKYEDLNVYHETEESTANVVKGLGLWGTEKAFKREGDVFEGPHVEDGVLRWQWWDEVEG